jgi:hypothetical protein
MGIPTSYNLDTPKELKSWLSVRIHIILAELPHSTEPLTQRCFDWRSPIMDPVNRGAMSRGRKGAIHGGDMGIVSPLVPSPPR